MDTNKKIWENDDFDFFEEERRIRIEITEDYEVDLDFELSSGNDLNILMKDNSWSGPIHTCYTGISDDKAIDVIVALAQHDPNKYVIKVLATTIDGVKRYELSYTEFWFAYRALAFLTNLEEDFGMNFWIGGELFEVIKLNA